MKNKAETKRTVYVVGNWKSHPSTLKDLEKLQKGYQSLNTPKEVRLVVCPSPIHQLLELKKPIYVGAQDVSLHDGTGRWNIEMLKQLGTTYCILGHSEMRATGESDSDIRSKMLRVIESGIIPIVCIGETIRDDNGKYINIIKHQVRVLLEGLSLMQASRVIIAYEPVWAIGSGAMRPCEPAECYEATHIIREEVARIVPQLNATSVVVLYGGSVDSSNAASYVDLGSANGLLVGRASLDVVQMRSIIKSIGEIL